MLVLLDWLLKFRCSSPGQLFPLSFLYALLKFLFDPILRVIAELDIHVMFCKPVGFDISLAFRRGIIKEGQYLSFDLFFDITACLSVRGTSIAPVLWCSTVSCPYLLSHPIDSNTLSLIIGVCMSYIDTFHAIFLMTRCEVGPIFRPTSNTPLLLPLTEMVSVTPLYEIAGLISFI